jgi:hypothetical protein
MTDSAGCAIVSMEGEIVQLFDRGGRRLARIVLTPRLVCEVPADGLGDAHLGDRVVAEGRVTIEQVASVEQA